MITTVTEAAITMQQHLLKSIKKNNKGRTQVLHNTQDRALVGKS